MWYSYVPATTDSRLFHAQGLYFATLGGRGRYAWRDQHDTIQGLTNGSERLWGYAETLGSLGMMVMNFGSGSIIGLGGVTFPDKITQFLAGYNSAFNLRSINEVNPLVGALADTHMQMIVDQSIPIVRPIAIIGYSMGGCVAYELGLRLARRGVIADRIFTYGSPRPGGRDSNRDYQSLNIIRMYGVDDPVRAIPPHFNEGWSIWPLLSQAGRNLFNAQVHPAVGIGLEASGDFVLSPDVLPQQGGELIFDLARYWFGLELSLANNHSVTTYRDRLLSRPDQSQLLPPGSIRPRGEMPAVPTPSQTESVIESGLDMLDQAGNNWIPPREIFLTPPPGSTHQPFRAHHRGKVWTVEQYGVTVDVGPGKRSAKRKAHGYNKMTGRSS